MDIRSAVSHALALLSKRDRRLLGMAMLIQVATSLLDLVGILLLGLVGALAVTTVQSLPPPDAVVRITEALGLEGLSSQGLVGVLAAAAAVALLSKSVISSYLNRRVFRFLANRQALVSARLTRELLSRPLTFLQQRSSQETAYALVQGAGTATMGILGQLTVAVTEAALLLVLGGALLFVDPIVTVFAVAFFAAVAVILHRAMGKWASRTGQIAAESDIESLNVIQEAMAAYREISVSDRRSLYVERLQALRWRAAQVAADMQFIGMFPKYMFEAALVIGGLLLSVVLFSTQESAVAVGTLAVFIAAGSRVMPSILRLQGASLGLRSAAALSLPTFELASELGNPVTDPPAGLSDTEIRERALSPHDDFESTIRVRGVSVRYPGSPDVALKCVSLDVPQGQSVALVGRSGAGKSTLADVVLGVLRPDEGEARVSGVPAEQALTRWPGAMAYVPQDVVLTNGTVRSNVALGIPPSAVDDQLVWDALTRAYLDEYIRSLPEGLDSWVGERGVRLSGGQRQRIGIARALYTKPTLLVLDEATSALDAEAEFAIASMLRSLEGHVTTLVIAHRLSTVKHVDRIVYLEEGEVVAGGTFEEVRDRVPMFARQAELMGL